MIQLVEHYILSNQTPRQPPDKRNPPSSSPCALCVHSVADTESQSWLLEQQGGRLNVNKRTVLLSGIELKLPVSVCKLESDKSAAE